MAHFAQLNEGNIVTQVVVVDNWRLIDDSGQENEQKGIEFLKSLFGQDTVWVQTSYNANFRYRMAAIDYMYDSDKDIFLPQQPYPSWQYDDTAKDWQPPVPYPQDGMDYIWDETNQQWLSLYVLKPPTTPTP